MFRPNLTLLTVLPEVRMLRFLYNITSIFLSLSQQIYKAIGSIYRAESTYLAAQSFVTMLQPAILKTCHSHLTAADTAAHFRRWISTYFHGDRY